MSSRICGPGSGARAPAAARRIVGSVDQVLSEIEAYQKMGIRAFIFSGYPHLDECRHFGTKVLPHLKTCSLPEVYGRVPASIPATPLGVGVRS
jgi:alkanesulfonate monooxygenase